MKRQSWPLRTLLGSLLLASVIIFALAGLIVSPYDPLEPDFAAQLQAPSAQHWMGTDQFGRDVLSRLMAGATTSILISLGVVSIAVLAGTLFGLLSGYFGGVVDRVIGFFTNTLMAFPGLLFVLGLMAVIGPSRSGVVLALGAALTPTVIRVVRSSALSVRRNQFVEASIALGQPHGWIMLRHMLPNCLSPLIVLSTSLIGVAVLTESALSFLGLGVPPPHATWGGMLADARPNLDHASWLAIFPGAAISIALLGINLVGDAVRDRFDPRMRTL